MRAFDSAQGRLAAETAALPTTRSTIISDPARLFPMQFRQRQQLVFTGAPLAIVPALAFLPALAYLVLTPVIRHSFVVAFLVFPICAFAEVLGLYRLVRCCMARPFDLLTMFAAAALLILVVIAAYTGFFLAAIAGLF